jgi:hypothetical protein
LVKVRSYGRYDVNGFRFHSTAFEALHPLVTTTNSGVVTWAIDAKGRESNYGDMTHLSLHTRSNKCIICLIHVKS